MAERIGDIVEIETENRPVIALRGIIAITDTGEHKPEPRGFMSIQPCTAIIIEGGKQINVSREDGDFIRRCFKDYAREQAAQKALR